jgi:anti-sigma B factor antagonist
MSIATPPLEPTLEILRPRPATVHVLLGGEHDLSSAPRLQEALDRSLPGCSHLIVDLTPAEFIDSTVINMLVRARNRAFDGGSEFTLVLVDAPIVERALEITGVLSTLNRVATIEEALARSPARGAR